jgi:hypothetical protein
LRQEQAPKAAGSAARCQIVPRMILIVFAPRWRAARAPFRALAVIGAGLYRPV